MSKRKLRKKALPVKQKSDGFKFEFGKFIIGVYALCCIAWVQQDYVLAFKFQTPVNYQTTGLIIGSLVILILGYYMKSYKEKSSRNQHKLDENGVPYSLLYNQDSNTDEQDSEGSDY